MPPETEPLTCPPGRGRDTVPFLESIGLSARVPPINSGAYETALSNPTNYYITYRLGLTKALRWSKALSRGSWLHKANELHDFTSPVPPLAELSISPTYASYLRDRTNELSKTCAAMGIIADARQNIISREEQDAHCAWAWYYTACSIPVGDYGTFFSFVSRHMILGREISLAYNDPKYPNTPLIGHLDMLLYNRETNLLWIVDLKTCDESPLIRMATTKIEFQTWHYLYLCQNLLLHLIRAFNLPSDARLGGMIHVAIQKPTIELGLNDRDYQEIPFTPKTGKNKGITRMEKVYQGEPRLSNYLIRCAHWYRGTGDYAHLPSERGKNIPVNMIHTPTSFLDDDLIMEYHQRVQLIRSMATREAYPGNFHRSARGLRENKKLDDLAPFSLTDPKDWPAVIKELGFITRIAGEEVYTDGVQEDH